jgi:erythromycin esterase-like protein
MFALGFSAYSGSYRVWGTQNRDLPQAAPGSLEAIAIGPGTADAVYLGPRRLKALGSLGAYVFSHEAKLADWSAALDGVVVFREERPPRRIQ